MKRILSLLLSVVMLVSAMSLVDFSAFAGTYEDYEYTVSADNSVQITKYKGSANALVIPSAIAGKAVRSIGYKPCGLVILRLYEFGKRNNQRRCKKYRQFCFFLLHKFEKYNNSPKRIKHRLGRIFKL